MELKNSVFVEEGEYDGDRYAHECDANKYECCKCEAQAVDYSSDYDPDEEAEDYDEDEDYEDYEDEGDD